MFHKVRAFCYADFDKKLRKSGELCKILRTEKHEEIMLLCFTNEPKSRKITIPICNTGRNVLFIYRY